MPRSDFAPETKHQEELGFRIWEQIGPEMMAHPHTHPDIEINYLLDGGFSYLHGGAVIPVEAGRLTVLWGGVPHQTIAPGIVGRGIWMTLPLAWILQWRLPYSLPDRLLAGEIISAPPDAADAVLLQRWEEDARSGDAARHRVLWLEIEARFHRLALGQPATRVRPHRGSDGGGEGQIARATRYMAQHYREAVSVQIIADAMGLHPKYLMRVFKKQCGTSLWGYLTRLRVSHAQRLLITTDMKVLDVALESGFSSSAPFYAAFPIYSRGLRPLDYRRQHQLSPHPSL